MVEAGPAEEVFWSLTPPLEVGTGTTTSASCVAGVSTAVSVVVVAVEAGSVVAEVESVSRGS